VAEVFNISGESDGSVVAPSPQLQGLFIPGIDNPLASDGFGIVTPWGGGSTARRYGDYGISTEISSQSTQLYDLASNLVPTGGGATFNLEGLIGPQGPQGPQGPPGPPGITGFSSLPYGYVLPMNSNFLAAFPHNLDQINDLGTAANKLIYTDGYNSYYDEESFFEWESALFQPFINDMDVNDDGSFCVIADDDYIYTSTNYGISWGSAAPDSERYDFASCDGASGKAVVVGYPSAADGIIRVTTDYGVSWSEIEVTQ